MQGRTQGPPEGVKQGQAVRLHMRGTLGGWPPQDGHWISERPRRASPTPHAKTTLAEAVGWGGETEA